MIIDLFPPLHATFRSPCTTAMTLQGRTPLDHLGLIRAQGEDAAKFLHGQLTQDFALLGLSESRLAAFCSAKGRMQASFIGFKRAHDDILLVCSRDLLAATLKRLSMFVLRAKVRLTDATADFQLVGLTGSAMPADLPATPWTQLRQGDISTVRLYPAEGLGRALQVAPAGVPLPEAALLDTHAWSWLEVRSGVATLSQPVFEAFVPQMLNYESVGGVNFKKGCYPGQEVVARSQFRGTLKRRGAVLHGDGPLAAGDEVFHDSDPSQPCGLIAQAAPHPEGGFDAIASLQVSAMAGGQLSVGGRPLQLLPLPYPLLDDI